MIEELNGDFLQWLRGFYFVAKSGSVRRAAELMHRNPSTISYQIKSLEEELGTVLFDRFKKSLRITREGKKLLGWTIATFETLQNMRASVGSGKGDLRGDIHISSTLPVSTFMTDAICEFVRKHPHVHLMIERGLSGDVRKAVLDSVVDFGIMPVINKPAEGTFQMVYNSRPMLVMKRDTTWNVPPIPEMADLEKLPFVAFRNTSGADELDDHVQTLSLGDFIHKNAVIETNNYLMLMRFVSAGLGAGIVDELCFHNSNFAINNYQLRAVPLDHILPNRLYGIYTRPNKHLSPQAQALLKHLYASLIGLTLGARSNSSDLPPGYAAGAEIK